MEIKERFTKKVLHTSLMPTLRQAVEEAVKLGISLCFADLKGAYLSGANLRSADLRGADLCRADLTGAYLQGAYLQGALLNGADLKSAFLRGAYLRAAILRGVDFMGADLRDAILRGAELDDSNLRDANLRRTDLGTNLKGALLRGAVLMAENFAPNCFYTFQKRGGRKCYAIIEPYNDFHVRIIADCFIAGCFNDSIEAFEATALKQYGDDEAENYQPELLELKPKIKEAIAKLKSENETYATTII